MARRLGFEIQSKALHDYFKTNEAFLATDAIQRNLAEKCLTSYAVSARELYDRGDIPLDHFKYAAELAVRLKSTLEGATEEHKRTLEKQAPLGSVEEVGGASWPRIISLEPPKEHKGNQNAVLAKPRMPFLRTLKIDFKAASLPEEFSRFSHALDEFIHSQQWKIVRFETQDLAKELPLTMKNTCWESLSHDEAMAIVKSLAQIAKAYVRAREARKKDTTPQDLLAAAKLFAVAEMLVRHHEPVLCESLPSLAPPSLMSLMSSYGAGNVLLPVYDANWDDQLRQLVEFWSMASSRSGYDALDLRKSGNDFFGFVQLPTDDSPYLDQEHASLRNILERPRDQELLSRSEDRPWDLNFEWKDVEWAKQWVARPEVQDRIANHYSYLLGSNDVTQAMAALYDTTAMGEPLSIIPEGFFALRDLAFYTDYTGSQSSPPQEQLAQTNYEEGVQFWRRYHVASGQNGTRIGVWHTGYRLFGSSHDAKTKGGSPSALNTLIAKTLSNWLFNSIENWGLRPGEKKFTFDEGHDEAGKALFSGRNPGDAYYPPHTTLVHLMGSAPLAHQLSQYIDPYKATGFEHVRRNLKVEEDDLRRILEMLSVPELAPIELLGYYMDLPALLRIYDHQQVFKRGMFQGSLLRLMLSKDPQRSAEFAEKAAAFTAAQYLEQRKFGDLSTTLFFLEVIRYFDDYLSFFQRTMPQAFPKEFQLKFLDSRKELREILQQDILTMDQRGFVVRVHGDSLFVPACVRVCVPD